MERLRNWFEHVRIVPYSLKCADVCPFSISSGNSINIALLFTGLLISNGIIWIVSIITYDSYMPNNKYLLAISYLLGLRHAFDADHIASIDNVTSKFVQSGQQPLYIGFFFSLGHSTIVIVTTSLIIIFSESFNNDIDQYSQMSGFIGSSISSAFLLFISMINLYSLYSIYRAIPKINREEATQTNIEESGENIEDSNESHIKPLEDIPKWGCCSTLCGNNIFHLIDRSWKMYFVGVLFGLGFDTSTEIGLLGIVALQSTNNNNRWMIICFPLLFTCGMCLIDTIDGVLMSGIYGSQWVTTDKKIYCSFVFTMISFQFAFVIAIIEILGIFQQLYYDDDQIEMNPNFWGNVYRANDKSNFMIIGIVLLATFIGGSALSYCIFHRKTDTAILFRGLFRLLTRRKSSSKISTESIDVEMAVLSPTS